MEAVAANSPAITENELITLVSQAHSATALLFTDAFETELNEGWKPAWSEVSPQLLNYWSSYVVDGDLKEFYESHLWDWGYEMGFAFPLWNPELIESVTMLSANQHEIVAEFKAPTNYDTTETIRLRLIQEGGRWLIASCFGIHLV